MNLETTYELDAPAEYVFKRITDHADFEALLMGYGANIERLDDETSLNIGMKWAIDGNFRGKQRQVEVALTQLNENELVGYSSVSKDVNAVVDMKLEALSPTQTRFSVDITPKANTISARLILQSAKLARKTLEKRINRRFADFCQRLEDDYRDISRG
jgi:carbon monoxide dehydrogenase subunit G